MGDWAFEMGDCGGSRLLGARAVTIMENASRTEERGVGGTGGGRERGRE